MWGVARNYTTFSANLNWPVLRSWSWKRRKIPWGGELTPYGRFPGQAVHAARYPPETRARPAGIGPLRPGARRLSARPADRLWLRRPDDVPGHREPGAAAL